MTGIWSSGDCLSIEILFSKYPKCHTIQSADTRVELGGKIEFHFRHNIEELS